VEGTPETVDMTGMDDDDDDEDGSWTQEDFSLADCRARSGLSDLHEAATGGGLEPGAQRSYRCLSQPRSHRSGRRDVGRRVFDHEYEKTKEGRDLYDCDERDNVELVDIEEVIQLCSCI